MSLRFESIIVFALVSCSSSGGGDPQPADASVHLDPSECTSIAQSFVGAATTCGTTLPAGAQAMLEGFCKKGVARAALCGGDPASGFACFATPDPTDWTCQLGQPYPACNGDLAAALGMYCVIALGNPACASGIKCQFDSDCGGLACNDAIGECFSKTAYCIGLPCRFETDCPSNETCNDAEHACIGR